MSIITRCDQDGVPYLVQEYHTDSKGSVHVRTCENRHIVIRFSEIADDVLNGKCHIWPCADLSDTMFSLALEEYVGTHWQKFCVAYQAPKKKCMPVFCVGD